MNNFLRMCLNIITQIGPYLVVLLLLKYLVNLQQKRAKEREEEQKKGIIRTHYIIKTALRPVRLNLLMNESKLSVKSWEIGRAHV